MPRAADAEARPQLSCHAFNQINTHLAIGTPSGWQVVACDPFVPCHEAEVPGGVSAIQMLFSSSLIALVGGGERAEDSPRRLRLWNTSTSSPVFELTFATPVLRVLMNRVRLLVVLSEATHVFELATMRLLHQLETAPNPRGIAALSSSDESICAAWPNGHAPGWTGRLTIFDAQHGAALATVAAHHSSICCVAITPRGDIMATASQKGTVIRVHLLPSAECLHTFRRGSLRTTVLSLSFASSSEAEGSAVGTSPAGAATPTEPADADAAGAASTPGRPRSPIKALASSASRARAASSRRGPLLCATSSTGTVHIWRCGRAGRPESPPLGDEIRSSSGGGAASSRKSGGLKSITQWLSAASASASAERDLARVRLKLPADASWCVATLREESGGDQNEHVEGDGRRSGHSCSLYVLTARGEFFVYSLDVASGACTLQDERRLLPALA